MYCDYISYAVLLTMFLFIMFLFINYILFPGIRNYPTDSEIVNKTIFDCYNDFIARVVIGG